MATVQVFTADRMRGIEDTANDALTKSNQAITDSADAKLSASNSAWDAENSRLAAEAAEKNTLSPTTDVVTQVLSTEIQDPASQTNQAIDSAVSALGGGIFSDVGTHGNGVDDDSAILTTIIKNAQHKGVVKLTGSKTYAISSSPTMLSGTRIDGGGATLKWIGTGDRPLFFSAIGDVEISNLILDCGSTPPQSAIFGTNCDKLRFKNVKVVNTVDHNSTGFRLSGCTNSVIDADCDVQGGGTAWNLRGSSFCDIKESTATGVLAGVLINTNGATPSTDCNAIKVLVKDFPDGEVLSYPIRSAGTSTARNQRISFIGCKSLGKVGRGYIPDDGSGNPGPGGTADQINAVYTDTYTVIGCTSENSGDYGFSCSYCTDILYLGNHGNNNTSGGIVVSTNCSMFTIIGNECLNNGQNWDNHASNDYARYGIGTGSASDGIISGNTVGDNQAVPTQSYGVRLVGPGDNITVGPNTYKNNVLAKQYTDGQQTNVNNIDNASANAIGKQVAYQSKTGSPSVTTTAANTWTAFVGTPTITLPNDGAIYQVELHGKSVTVNPIAITAIGVSGDDGASMIRTSQNNHSNASVYDRLHIVAGHVVGSGQTLTVWGFTSAATTATINTDANGGGCELFATRVG